MARGNFKRYPNQQAMRIYEDGLARDAAPLVQIAAPALEETHA